MTTTLQGIDEKSRDLLEQKSLQQAQQSQAQLPSLPREEIISRHPSYSAKKKSKPTSLIGSATEVSSEATGADSGAAVSFSGSAIFSS
jgi:hypothetical protein